MRVGPMQKPCLEYLLHFSGQMCYCFHAGCILIAPGLLSQDTPVRRHTGRPYWEIFSPDVSFAYPDIAVTKKDWKMAFNYETRLKKLLEINGVDVVALVPGANMVYFTGLHFHLSERPIIAFYSKDGLSVIIPELEVPKLHERPDLEARAFGWNDTDGYIGAFRQAVNELGLVSSAVGVDGQTMRVFEFLAFQEAMQGGSLQNVGKALLDIRTIKAAAEVDAMRQAIRLSEEALSNLMGWVRPGMTERQIATQLGKLLQEAGTEGIAFEPLVQTGPNSALPHGFVTDRVLQEGEFLLVDFGGKKHEYPADITRTFCLGTPTDEMQKIYAVVLAANQAAIAASKPGATCHEVDKAARDVIQAAGYGEYFIHRTGHGLGLEGHELPQIASGVHEALQPGMVYTIEPGIYVPGLGGVRIEDNVAITEDGVEVLTQYPYLLELR